MYLIIRLTGNRSHLVVEITSPSDIITSLKLQIRYFRLAKLSGLWDPTTREVRHVSVEVLRTVESGRAPYESSDLDVLREAPC